MVAPMGYVDYGTIKVCMCCMLAHANGECCESHGIDSETGEAQTEQPEPWVKLPMSDGWDVAMGTDEHGDFCEPSDREDGCDCDHTPFGTSSCEGCGSPLAGDRYSFVLWRKEAA